MGAGSFNVAVVPAYTGLETSTTGIVVVEFLDNIDTVRGRRRDAIRRVVLAEELGPEFGLNEVIDRTVEIARPLGQGAKVLYSREGSVANYYSWLDAYQRTRELANRPRGVTIGGDGYTERDGTKGEQVGEDELIDKSLRQLVRTRGFVIEEPAALVAQAARSMVPDVSPGGKVKFGARKRSSLGFALALATYQVFAPGHADRRFEVPAVGKIFPSYQDARATLGQVAEIR